MTLSQRFVALLTFSIIGGMLLYTAFDDSTYTEKGLNTIANLDPMKLFSNIRTHLGILSMGLGVFLFVGRNKYW